MTFPSGVPDGYEYTNPDNNLVYRWDDPPGSWTLIGTSDGGGGTPTPPGEGLTEGTDNRVQCFRYQGNMCAQYSTDEISVRADVGLTPHISPLDFSRVFFSYSYDQVNWYPCTETGGAKQGQIPSIHKIVKSNGDTFWFAVEASFTSLSRIWKSPDGINWSTQSATGLPTSTSNDQWGVVFSSKDTLLLLPYKKSGSYGLVGTTYYASTDDGATWVLRTFPIDPTVNNVFIDENVMFITKRGQGGTENPDVRVSVDGGTTWAATSGLPQGGTTSSFNQNRAVICASPTSPKTYYINESINITPPRQSFFYLTLSDLESGTRAWTSVADVPDYYGVRTDNCYVHPVEDEGVGYLLYFKIRDSSPQVLVHKLSSDNRNVEAVFKNQLPGVVTGSGSNYSAFAPLPFYTSLNQPAKMLPLLQSSTVAPSTDLVLAGIGRDLYYNGIKVQFSSFNRLVI